MADWKQTLQDLDVVVCELPPSTKPNVTITRSSIKVTLFSKLENTTTTVVDKQLHKGIKVDESTWYIDSGKLVLSLTKLVNEWWSCVFVGDEEIDTTKIEPENSKLSDLDGETRSMVEKMMFEQNQKQKQEHEKSKNESDKSKILKQFMEQHPEMDFSNVKV
jgi:hypothetical protein